MNKAYIALGSNIAPRFSYLKGAVEELKKHQAIEVTGESYIYETAPVGVTDQNSFLNMVLEINTSFSPFELLELCQEIERLNGRKREIKWGPRTLDLDILLYNQENIETEQLIVPHPSMHERAFVLVPLKDIDPSIMLPNQKREVSAILDGMSQGEKKGVVRWVPQSGE